MRFLQQRKEVIPGCVGLMGFSEGEWVAPLAAAQSKAVAFLIVVGPSGVSPSRQVNQEIAHRLTAHLYPAEIVQRALALNDRVFAYQRIGQNAPALQSALRAAESQPWFAVAKNIPNELYPPDEYGWWRSVMDFDPAPIWAKVKVPVLLLKGGNDAKSDAAIARKEIEKALAQAGNRPEFVLFPEADHALLQWPLGERIPPPVFAPGYIERLKWWLRQRKCAAD